VRISATAPDILPILPNYPIVESVTYMNSNLLNIGAPSLLRSLR
jgi:hypothetical protein